MGRAGTQVAKTGFRSAAQRDLSALAIEAARARSAFMTDGAGFEFQILSYEADSPDIATW